MEAESKGKQRAQFFSDDPSPGNRTERVDEEVEKRGGPEPNYQSDSDDFHSIKIYVMKLPRPRLASRKAPAATVRARSRRDAGRTISLKTFAGLLSPGSPLSLRSCPFVAVQFRSDVMDRRKGKHRISRDRATGSSAAPTWVFPSPDRIRESIRQWPEVSPASRRPNCHTCFSPSLVTLLVLLTD